MMRSMHKACITLSLSQFKSIYEGLLEIDAPEAGIFFRLLSGFDEWTEKTGLDISSWQSLRRLNEAPYGRPLRDNGRITLIINRAQAVIMTDGCASICLYRLCNFFHRLSVIMHLEKKNKGHAYDISEADSLNDAMEQLEKELTEYD